MNKKINKAMRKMSRTEQLSVLMFLLQDYTNAYSGDSYDVDTCMATDISYLRGIVDALHTQNMISLNNHKKIAEACVQMPTKRHTYGQDDLNPFA
jgi:hypothetical protein